MKKKNHIYAGVVAILLTSATFSSCDSYLDINDNPNYPTTTTMAALLPSVSVSTIAQLGWNGATIGTMWLQHTTQGHTTNQYNTLVNYSISVSSFNALFTNPYANTLPDLQVLIQKAEAEKAWNYWVIGKILTAYNFQMLTDLYGDIPFTEAMDIKNHPYPKYDDSKTVVYPGILAMLNDAIAKEREALLPTNPTIGKYDMFLNGKIDLWIKFAKNLKLKVLMRDFTTNRTAIETLLDEGDFYETDLAMTVFEDASNKGNPFFEYNIRQLNTKENVRASHTLCEYLLTYDDPRIVNIYEMTANSGGDESLPYAKRYEGLPVGTRPTTAIIPLGQTSRYKQAYSDPVYLMNQAEIFFLEAEAYARLGDSDAAKEKYNAGVAAAFNRWPSSAGKATTYLTDGGAYAFDATSTESMLKGILTQKWVSFAHANSLDGVFDRNRTGIPAISQVASVRISNAPNKRELTPGYVLGTLVPPGSTVLPTAAFPRRLLVPDASSQYNPNAPAPKPVDEPLWWQIEKGK